MRVKPEFEVDSDWGFWGCFLFCILLIIWPGFLIAIGLIWIVLDELGYADLYGKGWRVKAAEQQWKASCVSPEVAIASRDAFSGGTFDINEYGETRTVRPRYELRLKLPDQTIVWARVSEDVYKKLEGRNTVRIYYDPDSPMTFMLEEEF